MFLRSLWQRQLEKEFDHINWTYRLNLTRPQFRIIEAQSFYGQWDPLLREIKIAASLIWNHPWYIVLEILKHEIAHQLVTDRTNLDGGHGVEFQHFCELLGVEPPFRTSKTNLDLSEISFEHRFTSHEDDVNDNSRRLISRVERLLSLAQSNSETEALAAMEKVNELYEKYNLELQKGAHRQKTNYSFLLIQLKSTKTNAIYSLICSILMEHYFVEVVLSDLYNQKLARLEKVVEIFGANENLRMAEYVFHFLVRTSNDLWTSFAKTSQIETKYRRSYQLGLLHGFNEKLRKSKQLRHQLATNEGRGMDLLLLEQDLDLYRYINGRYPRLRKRKSGSGRVYASAFSEGHTEGMNLILRKGIESSYVTDQPKALKSSTLA